MGGGVDNMHLEKLNLDLSAAQLLTKINKTFRSLKDANVIYITEEEPANPNEGEIWISFELPR